MRCASCAGGFEPRHPKARFCSSKCRAAAWKRGRAAAQAERDARLRLLAQETLRLLGDGSAAKAEEAVQEAMGGLAGGEGRAAAPAWPGDSV